MEENRSRRAGHAMVSQAWAVLATLAAVLLTGLAGGWKAAVSLDRKEERGDVIVQHLGVIVLAVVLLVGLFLALTALGNDVITYIRKQLGL